MYVSALYVLEGWRWAWIKGEDDLMAAGKHMMGKDYMMQLKDNLLKGVNVKIQFIVYSDL